MEACKQYFNTKYVRLPDLLIDLETERTDGNYKKSHGEVCQSSCSDLG